MTIESAVQALLAARRTNRPVPAPPVATEEDAYAIQEAVGRALGCGRVGLQEEVRSIDRHDPGRWERLGDQLRGRKRNHEIV